MFLLLRNKYQSGHYHSKQQIPNWYPNKMSNWYRDLKKMHDLKPQIYYFGTTKIGVKTRQTLEENKN